ncbi:MAG: short-subunit dehydrogenase [Rhodothermales bacterium]|jgi:short-subunit dehydrogenase
MQNLAGKRILLTGAAGGIGSVIVRQLTELKAEVLMVDVSETALQELADEVGQPFKQCDLGDAASRSELVNWVLSEFNGLDALVQCAGLMAFGLHDTQSDEQIERLIRINLVAPMQLSRALIPHLEKGVQPVIVNLGSVFGHIGFPGFSLYSASKFGLHGYTEALRRELADGPIRVAWVSPRATQTALNAGVVEKLNTELKVNTDSPETVAAEVIKAISQAARDKVLGFPEKLFARINQVFPSLVDGSLIKQLSVIRKYSEIQKETSS